MSTRGIMVDPLKVEEIVQLPPPHNSPASESTGESQFSSVFCC
jgi:hypothetical protein